MKETIREALGGKDTIVAIATPYGESAIGIVRLSGPDTLKILKEIFEPFKKKSTIKPRYAYYGNILEEGGEILDEAIVIYYKAPHSYTGEDMAEINLHGNPLILKKVLQLIIQKGARLAEPGEFTKRAFLNKKLDLTQAEAVAQLISAKTDLARKLALNQLKGALSKKIKPLREELLLLNALVESSIEFDEEDIPTIEVEELKERIKKIIYLIEELLKTAQIGKAITEGLKLAIVGKPNVGKSSLFNRLIGEERAIVTHIAGTTRDYIQEYINIEGVPIVLIDTAGIRKTEDPVEKIGVERSLKKLKEADLILVVLDISQPLEKEDEEILDVVLNLEKPKIIVLNKIDKVSPSVENANKNKETLSRIPSKISEIKKKYPNIPIIAVSAKTGEGIDELKKAILKTAGLYNIAEGGNIYITTRHEELLKKAKEELEQALSLIEEKENYSPEILMLYLRSATDLLGEITGEITTEDILGKIFSTFCIGK
jgi:tRNA modification GTPase